MKQKKVWRYWCDFCKKGGCSASAMRTHELRCTLNPNRECRLCKTAGIRSAPLVGIIESARSAEAGDAGWAVVMDAAKGCPVCAFAAIRLAGRTPGMDEPKGRAANAITFDLKKELADFWAHENSKFDLVQGYDY